MPASPPTTSVPDPRHALRRRCRRGAFTLIEMMVVVTILAVVAGIVVVKMGDFRSDAEIVIARAQLEALREAILGSPAGPGYLQDMQYVPGFKKTTMRVHDLLSPSRYPDALYDPQTRRGWRGPYLRNLTPVQVAGGPSSSFPAASAGRFIGDMTSAARNFYGSGNPYGAEGEAAIGDPWGNPYVLQIPALSTSQNPFKYARLVSAGPDGVLSTGAPAVRETKAAGMAADGSTGARGDDLVLFLNRPDVYE